MSTLYASRWAATPPPEQELKGSAQQSPAGDMEVRLKQDTESSPRQPEVPEKTDGTATRAAVVEDNEPRSTKMADPNNTEQAQGNTDVNGRLDTHAESKADSMQSTVPPTNLEPPRLRKRVSWRGKTCIISIPNIDFEAMGYAKPLDVSEVQRRLTRLQEAGFSVRGFELSDDRGPHDSHVRPIFPDETQASSGRNIKATVSLPDLSKWKAYVDSLLEQKLAALGVSTGLNDPSPAPVQDMSRQTSGQYPPLPFSPPLSTGSAGSVARPTIMRGHSHTMSVASPLSPGNGPFGHMHRHSTFTGPFAFNQTRQQQLPPMQSQQSVVPGMAPFSGQQQSLGLYMPRGGSPAQVAALRQDYGLHQGPGSPLGQQMFAQSPQDYTRALMEDQRRRQHAYSQSVQHSTTQNSMNAQMPSSHQTPALPELPEEDDEEELTEPTMQQGQEPHTYVPPHKRAQFNGDVATPTPTRGHQHNISAGLEQDILEAEQRREADHRNWIEVTEQVDTPASNEIRKSATLQEELASDTDSRGQAQPVQTNIHSHKKSASRFNVAAPPFQFNPTSSLKTFGTPFNFAVPHSTTTNGATSKSHARQPSSGALNVTAPPFQPGNASSMPKSEFSFSAGGPSFKPTAPIGPLARTKSNERTIVDELSSIFGKVNIPEIVKPARRSKAVPIVRPNDTASNSPGSESDFEDEEGRIAQSDDRLKRQRFVGGDGDEVPRFAEPTPEPDGIADDKPPASQPAVEHVAHSASVEDGEAVEPQALLKSPPQAAGNVQASSEEVHQDHGPSAQGTIARTHKVSTSLSALAKSFDPGALYAPSADEPAMSHQPFGSVSELEDGEIDEDETRVVSPVQSGRYSEEQVPALPQLTDVSTYSASERIDKVEHPEPSFDEIDAVMRQLNEAEAEEVLRGRAAKSPLPNDEEQPLHGVTYLAEWARSNGPSPSPNRPLEHHQSQADSSFTVHDRTDSGEPAPNGWPRIHRLNKAEEVPTSDWSGVLSPPDEEKLQHRTMFFDTHVDDIIGKVVERRLQPLEESLQSIQDTVNRRTRSSDAAGLKRNSSNIDSDADDEDDLSDALRQRPISRGRDKRADQVKAAVLEALREQSPRRSQSSYDISDLHSALADMKVSFARAASASLELDDVRAVVEEVLNRQSQAIVPVAHKRELSELEGRLRETLEGALEEANHRRIIEERESETRRMLQLAEEELSLLRDSSRDDDGRFGAMEEERRELLERVERAEEAQRSAEEQAKNLEAENEAMQATLTEYRMSSSKWRQDIDDAKHDREVLETTIAGLERQVEDSQESGASMRRRLEKLHADMATAAGQLASEKASWKAREEDYRSRCEVLETQEAARAQKYGGIEEELRLARSQLKKSAEAETALANAHTSNASLEHMVKQLQADLAEQQALVTRLERKLEDAALELESAKGRHSRVIEDRNAERDESSRAMQVALDRAREEHDAALRALASTHARALEHALEDKQRSEYILNERLALADAKVQHLQDRIQYLEERVEVAKSAAQAAAITAQSRAATSAAPAVVMPEKVSPQALRESILVLQEQLQEREATIDRLQNRVDDESAAKLGERDSEISWLRELLAVRNEDLSDLINTLSRPIFDRDAVRDTAIRIRANLQMEQQERERFGYAPQILGSQALASLSTFATPKAASLTSAFNKWRSIMESSALRNASKSTQPARSATPSKAPSAINPAYMAGLMTPPASNLRTTPSPEGTASIPPPRLHSGGSGPSHFSRPPTRPSAHIRQVSASSDLPTTPLFREQSYDRDAEDKQISLQSFDDDDLGIADSKPPAFRSLDSEVEPSSTATLL